MLTFTALALTASLFAPAALVADDPIPDKAVEVNIEKLTSVDYREGEDLPDEITELDGKLIEIEGYMAIGTLEGVEKFELVPEACECGRSKVQHFIDVSITEGTTTFKPGRIILKGKFSVGEVEEDGFVVSLYRLEIVSLDDE
ncbi:MAG: hypothetical protein O2816_17270 [Planctomycetota bacterium]|nr:hypothetical protein [Planctomycetota bacterium]